MPKRPKSPQPDTAAAARPGVWGRLTGLFRGEAEAEPAVPDPDAPGEDDHWVPLTLDSLLNSRPDAEVHVVTLKQFRLAIGPTWDRVRPKVVVAAETILARAVGPGNLMMRQGDDVFILGFPTLPPAEARARAFRAAVLLGKRLVGARFSVVGDGDAPPPLVGFASGPGADLLDADGTVDATALAAMEDAAAGVEPDATAPPAGPERHAQSPGIPNAAETRKPPGAGPDWQPLDRGDPRQKSDVRLVPMDPPRRKIAVDPQWVPIRKD